MDLEPKALLFGFLAFFVTAWVLPVNGNWRILIAISVGSLAYALLQSDEE
jgi:hypothetical protein